MLASSRTTRGGSSGSPLFDANGRIVAMINTGTGGAAPGGDCYLNRPCERTAGGVTVVADRSYAVPVAGIDLRRTPAGEWFCFEVNPSPAFSWFDAPDCRIAKRVAALLAEAPRPER